MTTLTTVILVLAAMVLGVGCTLFVQAANSLRSASQKLGRAGDRIAELARAIQPTAERVDRMTAMAEESDQDIRVLQQALHNLAVGSAELTENLSRVSRWVSIATPAVIATVDSFMRDRGAPEDSFVRDRGAPEEPMDMERGTTRHSGVREKREVDSPRPRDRTPRSGSLGPDQPDYAS